jgi:hypothetical protein
MLRENDPDGRDVESGRQSLHESRRTTSRLNELNSHFENSPGAAAMKRSAM